MEFSKAVQSCHVRSGIRRPGGTVYWKNSYPSLELQAPMEDQIFDDWEEYDPREQPECSAFEEMPA